MYSTKIFSGLSNTEIRNRVYDYYRDVLQQSSVLNRNTGITIYFNAQGKRKTASLHASKEKSIVIMNFKTLLANAIRVKSTEVKAGSSIAKNFTNAIFVINLLIKCKIDGKLQKFICGIVVTANGKFQYSLYHNTLRKIK